MAVICHHHLVAITPARRLAVQLTAGVLFIAAVVVILWFLSGFASARFALPGTTQRVTATVLKSASCQGQDANDTVSFTVGGVAHQAKLDACGHQQGERVQVLLPVDATTLAASTVVEPADAAPGDSAGLSHRVAFLLLVVSAAVGGSYSYFVYRRPGDRGAPRSPGRARRLAGSPAGAFESEPADDPGQPAEVNWFDDSSADHPGLDARANSQREP